MFDANRPKEIVASVIASDIALAESANSGKRTQTMEDLLWRNTVPNSVDGTTPAWIATFFAFLAEPNIRDVEAELSGKKRVPQP